MTSNSHMHAHQRPSLTLRGKKTHTRTHTTPRRAHRASHVQTQTPTCTRRPRYAALGQPNLNPPAPPFLLLLRANTRNIAQNSTTSVLKYVRLNVYRVGSCFIKTTQNRSTIDTCKDPSAFVARNMLRPCGILYQFGRHSSTTILLLLLD